MAVVSTNRRAGLPPSPKGPDGRHLCRWCRKPVDRPRLYWCSDACVEQYSVRANPGHARLRVWERDKGVCALCGTDVGPAQEELDRLWRRTGLRDEPSQEAKDRLAALGFPWSRWRAKPHLWEADHIVPVVEGGGETGLDNLRTLCLRCHRAETAKLARRRAAERSRKRFEELREGDRQGRLTP